MGTLTLTDPVNGTTIDASLHATNNANIKTVVNGGIDNTNISSGAAIAVAKIAGAGTAGSILHGDGVWYPTYRKVTTKDIVSSAAETDLLNGEVTLAALVSTSICRVFLIGDYLNNTGSNQSLTLKAKLGTTTLWGDVLTIVTGATRRPWRISYEIANLNATNSQFASGLIQIGAVTGGSVAGQGAMNSSEGTSGSVLSATGMLTAPFSGSATEDTTSSKALVMTATHGASSASLSIRLRAALVEVI